MIRDAGPKRPQDADAAAKRLYAGAMRALLPICLASSLVLAACTVAEAPPSKSAPKPAAPAATTTAPAAPLAPAEADAAALARELEIERLYRSALPFRRGGAFGLALVDETTSPVVAPAEARAAWEKAAERLRGRFGALRPVTPLAADLAQGADPAAQTPTLRLRRAGAAQGLDYLIVYRLDTEAAGGAGLFSGGARTTARAEAAILDVRTGAVLGAVATDPSAPAKSEGEARAAAMTALGDALDGLGRRLDADAMRAAAPPT